MGKGPTSNNDVCRAEKLRGLNVCFARSHMGVTGYANPDTHANIARGELSNSQDDSIPLALEAFFGMDSADIRTTPSCRFGT